MALPSRHGIRALTVWNQARYLSVTEAPHNIGSLRVSGENTWRPELGSNPRSPIFQAGSFNHCNRAPANSEKHGLPGYDWASQVLSWLYVIVFNNLWTIQQHLVEVYSNGWQIIHLTIWWQRSIKYLSPRYTIFLKYLPYFCQNYHDELNRCKIRCICPHPSGI